MSHNTQKKPISLLLKGWCSGISQKDINNSVKRIIETYKIDEIDVISWDGDLLVIDSTPQDKIKGYDKSFSNALLLLKSHFYNTSFVAFKKNTQIHYLKEDYIKHTKYGYIESGFPTEIFGELNIIDSINSLDKNKLNVISTPSDIKWDQLGIINTEFWFNLNYNVIYITLGGGETITKELSKLDGVINTLWRLDFMHYKGDNIETVKEQYIEYK